MGRNRTNDEILRDFEKGLLRDKTNDIVKGNFLQKNKIMYDKIMFDFLHQRVRDLFSDFVEKMNKEKDGEEKYFLEGLNRKIEIRKMF